MLTVTIEPGVLARPAGSPSAESIRSYLLRLLYWKAALDNNDVTVLITKRTGDILFEYGIYPERAWLRDRLREASVTEFDFNTVAYLVTSLLGRSQSLENNTGIQDILYDTVTISPNVFNGHSPGPLKTESEKCALIVAVARSSRRDPSALGYGIATVSTAGSRRVSVRAAILLTEHTRGDLNAIPVVPNYFNGDAVVCESLHDFILGLDEVALWKAALTDLDIGTAIKIAMFKSRIVRGLEARWGVLPGFRTNARLYASLTNCGALASDTLAVSTLRAMVETIEDIKMDSTHALRCGDGPCDAQRQRGDDFAFRRDISREHHLHYWLCHDGAKEFSCVGPHNSFDIYE